MEFAALNGGDTTFGVTEEQLIMRTSVLALLERALPAAKIAELDESRAFPFEAYRALAEAGWMGLPYPSELGGLGGTFKDLTIFIEAVSYHNAQMASAYLTTVIYGGMQIRHSANHDLRHQIMPEIVSGQKKLAFCMTEPGTGSDVSAVSTRAVVDGGDFIVNGQKTYITCAHVADYLVVVVKTRADAGHKGLSLLLVDRESAGVTIRPLRALGRRMIHTNEVFFDSVRVPRTRLLSELDGGWANIMRGLSIERLCLSAAASGNCRRIIATAASFARDREQFGRRITEYQAISHKLADMRILAETAQVLSYRVAEMLDAGLNPVTETAIAKVVATENNFRCADMGMQIMGGAGYMMDSEMQMYLRDSRVGPIGGGTSEIMRNVIARQMLA
ncbi:MAG: acyl-CoA dehydrogenase [Kaistia sp. SCN 65-12]|uniref:acyl-CoA dehydrogenase family protein n=1 Tax=Hyphomicrobium sp. CS1BSMeth3 TaxID=1892844 RepID=UPI00086DFA77|nr:acyl-CoA dehydrogenase family protein [Hyphomicrobium sp. CS1BSMeth3]ODT22625.1 MAG: acyl-CoA dehydrogenase [Kaistia sp. SCN 65-12]